MSATIVQLRHNAVIAIPDINQKNAILSIRVIKIHVNKEGTVINDPIEQINGSAYAILVLSLKISD